MLTLNHSIGGDRCRDHASEHLDLDPAARLEIDRQVGKSQIAADRKAVSAAAQPADHMAVAMNCLPTVDGHVVLATDGQRAQPPFDPCFARGQKPLAAVERGLVKVDAETE